MKRRQLLLVGGASVAGSAVVGSSAFSSVDADRDITIAIESDSDAYLKFEAVDDRYASVREDGLLELSFDQETDSDGKGLGTDAVYEFTNLFDVVNHGNKDVRIFGKYEGSELSDLQITDEETLTESNRSELITPGESLRLSVLIDTTDVDPDPSMETALTIIAARDGSERYTNE